MFIRFKSFGLMMLILSAAFLPNLQHASANLEKPTFTQRLNQLLMEEPDLKGAIAGISIRSADTGEILYDHLGNIRLRPASNLKLLTAAVALSVLGENYRFTTEVLTDGLVKKNTLEGNLYLKGKGDPTLLKADFEKIALEIKKSGIKKIHGILIGDDTWYDDVRYSTDLAWSDEQTYYGAQISALTASPTIDYDSGSVLVEIEPGAGNGDQAEVKVTPNTDFVQVVNHTKTVPEDGKKEIVIEREHAKNTILIKGTIPLKSKVEKEWIGVWEPTRYAMSLFKQALAVQGIQVTGEMKTGKTPEESLLLHRHQSIPLTELLIPFMKLSNNGHAETLVKEMGKVVKGEGSWEKGLEVMETELAKFGIVTDTLSLRDGSGISQANLVPANQISQLLYAVRDQSWFPTYLNSLPHAGEPDKMIGGSLRNRMKDPSMKGNIKAKTGTITSVSSLSGYVETRSGQTLIFSIVLNNLLDEKKGKRIEDKIVTTLANQ